MISTNDVRKPGHRPKKPGIYVECGPKGGKITRPKKTTIRKSTSMFPPCRKGNAWRYLKEITKQYPFHEMFAWGG